MKTKITLIALLLASQAMAENEKTIGTKIDEAVERAKIIKDESTEYFNNASQFFEEQSKNIKKKMDEELLPKTQEVLESAEEMLKEGQAYSKEQSEIAKKKLEEDILPRTEEGIKEVKNFVEANKNINLDELKNDIIDAIAEGYVVIEKSLKPLSDKIKEKEAESALPEKSKEEIYIERIQSLSFVDLNLEIFRTWARASASCSLSAIEALGVQMNNSVDVVSKLSETPTEISIKKTRETWADVSIENAKLDESFFGEDEKCIEAAISMRYSTDELYKRSLKKAQKSLSK